MEPRIDEQAYLANAFIGVIAEEFAECPVEFTRPSFDSVSKIPGQNDVAMKMNLTQSAPFTNAEVTRMLAVQNELPIVKMVHRWAMDQVAQRKTDRQADGRWNLDGWSIGQTDNLAGNGWRAQIGTD